MMEGMKTAPSSVQFPVSTASTSSSTRPEPPKPFGMCFRLREFLLVGLFKRIFFPFADSQERFLLRDMFSFRGELSYGTLYYLSVLSFPTPFVECCSTDNPLVVSLVWGFLFKMVAVLCVTTPFIVQEIRLSHLAEAKYYVPFPVLPHQILWLSVIYYHLYGAYHCMSLVMCREHARKTDPIAPIPFLGRIAWFCHVISLPGSLGGLILYLQLNHLNETPGSQEYRDAVTRRDFTTLCWTFETIVMWVDALLGQAVLLPSHLFSFLSFWLVYTALVLATEWRNLNIPLNGETFRVWVQCTAILMGVYMFFSFMCGLRLKLSRAPLPISKFHFYTPVSRVSASSGTTTTITTTTTPRDEEFPGA